MRRLINMALVALSSNRTSQRVLERLVTKEQWLMGIGAGSIPATSGEQVLMDRLRRRSALVKRPLCIFDVGANQGLFLSLVADGLRDVAFHVHAFEPSLAAFGRLADAHGHNSHATLNNIGLGSKREQLRLYCDEPGSEMASLYRRRLDHIGVVFEQSELVSIDTLDAYCGQHGVATIDLLKLDVEGHELEVLQGASDLFEDSRVDMVSLEFGCCNIDSRTFFQDFYYFFKTHGSFRIFRITPSGYLAPLDEYREVNEQFRTTNFLAVRDAGEADYGLPPFQLGRSARPPRR